MKDKFIITSFASADFREKFEEVAKPYNGNSRPLENILDMLKRPPLSCKTAVFEHDYVDKDYLDEFSAFYCKAFKVYPPRCVRILFFGEDLTGKEPLQLHAYSESFLGYVVLRPTDLQRVGRTLLRPPIQDKNNEFIHCLAEFETHVYGDCFEVSAMPFVQQDTQVGACAQASLWMLARYMSRRFGYRQYLPSEINVLAKSNLAMGRHFPASSGLTPYQVLDALQGMDFPAVIYDRSNIDACSLHINAAYPIKADGHNAHDRYLKELDNQRTAKLADITYRYIESALPVIIGTSDHALVVIGHTYKHTVDDAKAAIQRIPDFFVNNDNTGPYIRIPIFPTSASSKKLTFGNVQSIMAVLPREVTLRGEEAESMAISFIQEMLSSIPSEDSRGSIRDILCVYRPEFKPWLAQMESRTFLRKSVDYQKELKQEINRGSLVPAVGKKLRMLDYPKYVWITEISSPALLNYEDKSKRKCLGRVVVDSTAPAKTKGVLSAHFADLLHIENRDTGKLSLDIFEKSTPFHHILL